MCFAKARCWKVKIHFQKQEIRPVSTYQTYKFDWRLSDKVEKRVDGALVQVVGKGSLKNLKFLPSSAICVLWQSKLTFELKEDSNHWDWAICLEGVGVLIYDYHLMGLSRLLHKKSVHKEIVGVAQAATINKRQTLL